MRKKINIHIYQSDLTKESRMFKISNTLERITDFDKIILAGIKTGDLPLEEKRTEKIFLRRAPVFGIANRKVHYILYYLWLFIFLIKKRPKVLNVHSLELLIFAFFAKVFLRSKVIYDTHELETEKMGMSPKRKKISKFIERIGIKFCDETIVVGESIANHYKEMYPKLPKPKVVLNVPNYKEIVKKDKFRDAFDIDKNTLIYLYQGVLNKGRGIELIIKTFVASQKKDAVVVFLGYGPYEAMVKKASENNSNIYFHEAVSPEELVDYTSSADIGLCLIENECLSYYYSLPNKMFQYTMCNLPVITSNGYEMKTLVNLHKIGYVVESEEELSEIVSNNTHTDNLKEVVNNVKSFKHKFNWETQESILKEVYTDLL